MTTVVVTAVVMATLMAVLFWSISRCRPGDCQSFFQKEALPPSLVRRKWELQLEALRNEKSVLCFPHS